MRSGFLKLPWRKVSQYGYTSKLWAWIYANDNPGVTVRELAHLFDISHHNSNSILFDIRGPNKTEQKSNKIEQVPNNKPIDNAGSQAENKQDRTGIEQDRTKPEQTGSETIPYKEKKKIKKSYTPPEGLELPDWIPLDAWIAWMEVRDKKKAVQTASVLAIAIKKLAVLKEKGFDVEQCLERAALQNWTGIQVEWFKMEPSGNSAGPVSKESEDRQKRLRELKDADEQNRGTRSDGTA